MCLYRERSDEDKVRVVRISDNIQEIEVRRWLDDPMNPPNLTYFCTQSDSVRHLALYFYWLDCAIPS